MLKKNLWIIVFLPVLLMGQQALKGKFLPPEEFDWVLVYKVSPTHSSYVGDAKIDQEGNFEFVLDSTQTGGMYRLVYAVPQEEYNFDLIYNAREDVEFTFHIDDGLEYQASVENKLMSSYTSSMSMISQSLGKYFREQSRDSTALMTIFNTQRDTQEEYERISENMIAGHFVRANRPYIPDEFEDMNTYVANIKAHYFDHVDFNDPILQSSNFLIEHTLNFVFGMVSKDELRSKGYEHNIDQVVEVMASATDETKKMLLHILWQQFSEANYEKTANYITDNYLLDLAKSLEEHELVAELTQYKNVSLGHTAPNFKIESQKDGENLNTELHALEGSEHYILVFWSSSCSHCLEELPKLKEFTDGRSNEQLQVVAFGIEDDVYRWKNETLNYPGFTHVCGLGKWENPIGRAYNISSTPTYFILDKEKAIIAKPEDVEAVKMFFDSQK